MEGAQRLIFAFYVKFELLIKSNINSKVVDSLYSRYTKVGNVTKALLSHSFRLTFPTSINKWRGFLTLCMKDILTIVYKQQGIK